MEDTSKDKKVSIGILAHVDAGKTTFSEQLLFNTKAIRSCGRVDHKNSFMDNHPIEKERGITIFSDIAIFNYNNSKYFLVDTPGHVDFATEMERSLSILDYSILLVSALDGVQSHTETLWQLLKDYNIPSFIFINKLDNEVADVNNTLKEITSNLDKNVLYIDKDLVNEDFNEDEIEFIAGFSEELLELYLNGEYSKNKWIKELKVLIKNRQIFIALGGSALKGEGISNFLSNLDLLTTTNYNEDEKLSGKIFKIAYDENNSKVTFIKLLSGVLKVKDEIQCNNSIEKINSIRMYSGSKFVQCDEATAGDIIAVTGLNSSICGEYIGDKKLEKKLFLIPTLMTSVLYNKEENVTEILNIFRILENEEPTLNVIWNEKLSEITIHVMGKIQLEILKEVIKERFKKDIDFGPCKVLYKETINKTVIGRGHFEPLRHYAEVHLLMEPADRGTGITFENKCHTDYLTTGQMNLIKTHIFERSHKGILTGSEITDIKFTLLIGKAHLKHTESGDFREATYRAIRQGLEKSENILLEPYYKFKISVSSELIGRIISDIQRLCGTFESPEINEEIAIIEGRGPVRTFMNYSEELAILSKGRGKVSFLFDGYDKCHNSDEVIEEIGYDKNSDIEYTSSSVFCSKGSGFIVPWDEADNMMHCDINLEE